MNSILEELNCCLTELNVSIETGALTETAPDAYIILTPLADVFDLHADNRPGVDIQEIRISLYSKYSYTALKNNLVRILLNEDFTISDRRYNGYETDTGYHHYTVDVAKYYEMEDK